MNNKDVGIFIASLRKDKRLTQKQLADEIGVTNKAISKWETGEGYPDITTLLPLANCLGVTVDELLNGKLEDVLQEELQDSYTNKVQEDPPKNVVSKGKYILTALKAISIYAVVIGVTSLIENILWNKHIFLHITSLACWITTAVLIGLYIRRNRKKDNI